MHKRVPFAFGLAMLALPALVAAAPGDLDPTFGGTGTVVTPVTAGFDSAWGVVVQPDGKIVAAGQARSTTTDFALVRHNPDGTLDGTFGTGGIVTTPIGTGDEIARAVVRQPDGKLVAAGYARIGANNDFALVRYLADGTLDATFGTGGIVTTPIGAGNDNALAVALQPDGKILAAGYATMASLDMAVVRYLADGTLDATFGTGGIVTAPVGPGIDVANGLALQPDGKVLVVGYTADAGIYDIALLRFAADGTPDTGFDGDGTVVTAIGPGYAIGTSAVVQPDGRITVAGYTTNGANNDFALVRYNADGSLDTTFDGDGTVQVPVGGADDQGRALLREPDGRLLVAGLANNGTNADLALAKFNADGSLDTGFGTGGTVTVDLGGTDGFNAVAVQTDGRVVAAGFAGPPSTPDTVVARFENVVCGNGVADAGEACDAGSANGAFPSCCSATCTLVPAGTECRGAVDACDLAETCDGVSDTCPADAGLPDGDGDSVCDVLDNCAVVANPSQTNGDADALGDACDPCTNLVPTGAEKQILLVTKLTPPAGDEKLVMKGFFTGVPAAPTIDPVANGLRVLVTDALGATTVDVTIPGGAYDVGTKTGWRANGTGTSFKWKGPGTTTNGIQKVQLRAIPSSPGRFKFGVKGKDGSYPVNPANLPLTGTIVIDVPFASTGQCGEATFPAAPPAKPSCTAVGGGKTVKCK